MDKYVKAADRARLRWRHSTKNPHRFCEDHIHEFCGALIVQPNWTQADMDRARTAPFPPR